MLNLDEQLTQLTRERNAALRGAIKSLERGELHHAISAQRRVLDLNITIAETQRKLFEANTKPARANGEPCAIALSR